MVISATFILLMPNIRSGGISLESPNNLTVKVLQAREKIYHYARVQVKIVKACTLIIFMPDNPNLTPYQIVNSTSEPVTVNQKGVSSWETIPPLSVSRWTWDEPTIPHIIQVSIGNSPAKSYKMDKIKDFPSDDVSYICLSSANNRISMTSTKFKS